MFQVVYHQSDCLSSKFTVTPTYAAAFQLFGSILLCLACKADRRGCVEQAFGHREDPVGCEKPNISQQLNPAISSSNILWNPVLPS